jgi:predicted GH43/DUF377 family glycosyl hydrolase
MMRTIRIIHWVMVIIACHGTVTRGQFVWTKDNANPVLSGVSGAWNTQLLYPCVLYNEDSLRYEMWFNGAVKLGGVPPWYIGYASSVDPIHWKLDPTPVLSPDSGAWDGLSLDWQSVLREHGLYKMWYVANPNSDWHGSIGYATSVDGKRWSKFAGNPVLTPGSAAWEAGGQLSCCVLSYGGLYRMWYAATDVDGAKIQIGYATSADGIAWVRDSVHTPIAMSGPAGQWDAAEIGFPVVARIDDFYCMVYAGPRVANTQAVAMAGMALSANGVSWTRVSGNPVFGATSGAWDGDIVEVGSVLLRQDTLHLWYSGTTLPLGSTTKKIGHAVSALVIAAVERGRADLPGIFTLAQNFPNPFNPRTMLTYTLPERAHVTLNIFDMLGRVTSVLVDDAKEAGTYRIEWNASQCSSGIYYCRLQAGSNTMVRKLIVLR